MENVVSLSFENVVTITLMVILAWLVLTFAVSFLNNARA